MAPYRGDPRSIGVDAAQMIFTASGGAGGRVIAWVPGRQVHVPLAGPMDGDAMSVVATQDRVYVVGHFDHTVPDPEDPCLIPKPLPGGGEGVSCTERNSEPPPGRLPRQRRARLQGQEHQQGDPRPRLQGAGRHQRGPVLRPPRSQPDVRRRELHGHLQLPASQGCGTGNGGHRQPGFAVYPPLQ